LDFTGKDKKRKNINATIDSITHATFDFSRCWMKGGGNPFQLGAFNNYVDKKRGRGVLLNVHVDQSLKKKYRYFRKDFIFLCTGKKILLH
jgi:hypothetical protein